MVKFKDWVVSLYKQPHSDRSDSSSRRGKKLPASPYLESFNRKSNQSHRVSTDTSIFSTEEKEKSGKDSLPIDKPNSISPQQNMRKEKEVLAQSKENYNKLRPSRDPDYYRFVNQEYISIHRTFNNIIGSLDKEEDKKFFLEIRYKALKLARKNTSDTSTLIIPFHKNLSHKYRNELCALSGKGKIKKVVLEKEPRASLDEPLEDLIKISHALRESLPEDKPIQQEQGKRASLESNQTVSATSINSDTTLVSPTTAPRRPG